MTIALSDGVIALELDPDLFWDDEFTWQAVEQSSERSITGAWVVDVGERIAGRPITLRPEDDRSGWITRATMSQLQAWAAVPGQSLTLTLRGIAYRVIFRHEDRAIDAEPRVHYADPQPTDWLLATLRFITIE
jgi:hypothetical protein